MMHLVSLTLFIHLHVGLCCVVYALLYLYVLFVFNAVIWWQLSVVDATYNGEVSSTQC